MNIYDYIKLWIKNWFKSYKNSRSFVIDFWNNPDFIYSNILSQNKEIEVITSKEFIEAVEKSSWLWIDSITHKQAEAIRDWTFEKFLKHFNFN